MASESSNLSMNPDPKDMMEQSDLTLSMVDLFWDKLILSLATLITSLAAVDFLKKLVTGAGESNDNDDAICFVPEDFNASESQVDFIQNFCSQGIKSTQYLTLFLPTLAFVVGAVHFVWRSSVRNSFYYFFSLARTLEQTKDKNTGKYLDKNLKVIRKLQDKFSLSGRSEVLRSYQWKVCLQMLIALLSIALVVLSFVFLTDMDTVLYAKFSCPQNEGMSSWPYGNVTVECITSSAQLFWLLRLIDILLFTAIITAALCGLSYITWWPHPKYFNVKQAAMFSFITGMDSMFYEPKPFSHYFTKMRWCYCRRSCRHRRIKHCEHGVIYLERLSSDSDECDEDRKFVETNYSIQFPYPKISNDFHFLLVNLYRTDSNLGQVFFDGQVSIEHKVLVELDQLLVENRQVLEDMKQVKGIDSKKKIVNAISTGWTNTSWNYWKELLAKKRVVNIPVPSNLRGVLRSLALRAPNHDRAVSVSFGTHGFSQLLARSFKKVGSLNFDSAFDPDFDDGKSPVVLNVNATELHYHIVDDIFTRPQPYYKKFHEEIIKLLKETDGNLYSVVPFMVIAPITASQQLATTELLLGEWQRSCTFASNGVLVIVEMDEIENQGLEGQKFHLQPSPKYFEEFDPSLVLNPASASLQWPVRKSEDTEMLDKPDGAEDVDFEPNVGVGLDCSCGDTRCKFRIKCYRYCYKNS